MNVVEQLSDSSQHSIVYDLLRTKLLESQLKAEELNQSQSVGTCIVIRLFNRLLLRLRLPGFHQIVSNCVIRGFGRNVLISSSSALMTLFTSSSFVFDWVISVLRLSQTPSLGKTSHEVLYAFINLMGPLHLAIHVVQKNPVMRVSKNRTRRRQTKKITIVNDVSLLFVLSQCVSFSPRESLDADITLH